MFSDDLIKSFAKHFNTEEGNELIRILRLGIWAENSGLSAMRTADLYWFNPQEKEGACCTCELFPLEGKAERHEYRCPISQIHDALSALPKEKP